MEIPKETIAGRSQNVWAKLIQGFWNLFKSKFHFISEVMWPKVNVHLHKLLRSDIFQMYSFRKDCWKKFNFESSISLSHPGSDTSYYRKSSPRTSRTRSGQNSTCKSEEELDIKLPIGSLDGLEETWSSKYRKPLEKLKVIQKSQSQSQLTWDNSLPTLNHSRSWRNLTVDLFFEKNSKET